MHEHTAYLQLAALTVLPVCREMAGIVLAGAGPVLGLPCSHPSRPSLRWSGWGSAARFCLHRTQAAYQTQRASAASQGGALQQTWLAINLVGREGKAVGQAEG